ncbi:ABC-2 type transporter [Novosphingobium nitrogenifigens DSM 19370]|uniref:Transport permease protein n=1 Tax=Novosphingobium nitrogenifigens DSM 19370 TaxID=983920 RepID=F1Z539_9SPHN|nr:ABC transporter permease [Novosphingobium nitrogenifigens]EGD60004.1 ABC-2 type transporter [Novosphingobium nitrogenifigens DSM 19370]
MKLSRNMLHWRDLLFELVSRDLKVRYQRSAIGLGWSLMKPLAQLAIFATVFSSILPLDIKNYTTFVFTGVLVWAWFSSSLTSAAVSIVGSREMVRRPGFPVRLLPALTILSQGVHFILALPLLFVSSWIQIGPPPISALALPALILAQFVFTLAICNILASLHVFFRDIEHLVGITMMLGFYVTPVFYRPIDANQDYWFLTAFNPMAWILEGYRAIFVDHTWPPLWIYGYVTMVSVPLLLFGHWYFDRVSNRFVDEL